MTVLKMLENSIHIISQWALILAQCIQLSRSIWFSEALDKPLPLALTYFIVQFVRVKKWVTSLKEGWIQNVITTIHCEKM